MHFAPRLDFLRDLKTVKLPTDEVPNEPALRADEVMMTVGVGIKSRPLAENLHPGY